MERRKSEWRDAKQAQEKYPNGCIILILLIVRFKDSSWMLMFSAFIWWPLCFRFDMLHFAAWSIPTSHSQVSSCTFFMGFYPQYYLLNRFTLYSILGRFTSCLGSIPNCMPTTAYFLGLRLARSYFSGKE
eukprot:TRINITY_DN4743_c0_g2_i3.p1 TRINITY_DN4743_c0_g2~~TRINITY_DN4743_c0_g2_i3.p1  ORF type:complete len:130 (-),score=6.45 TRINITY_DN4743_c0_g2_i3:692-1081(-)